MTKKTVLLLLLAIIFFGVYAYFVTPWPSGTDVSIRFDWPDEVANYFWTKHYASTDSLILAEPLNQIADNQIHPRSFNVRADGSLVPGSFLGLILLYGVIAKIIGQWSIIYLTPLFAVLGSLAFYGIIRRIFDRQVAFLATILLFIQPAWWYYSVTSMLPNITFVSLLLLSFYFLLKNQEQKRFVSAYAKSADSKILLSEITASALFGALAIAIRPSELVWVVAVYLVLFLYIKKRLDLLRLVAFGGVVILLLLPSLYHQQLAYGGWLTTGYSQLADASSMSQDVCVSCSAVKSFFLPFGFHPTLVARNIWINFLSRFWAWALLGALGLAAFLTSRSQKRTEPFVYLLVGLFIAGFLAVYYGSWQFDDLLTLNLNTLGISYVRYWLPIYLLVLPLVAIGILWLSRLVPRRFGPIVLALVILALGYQSTRLVLVEKPDSILPVKNRIVSYQQTANTIIAQTETDSIIITVRKDKVFFPERKVIHTFDALTINRDLASTLSSLVVEKPVYYFALGQEPETDIGFGLELEEVLQLESEVLYKVVKK